jgi:radial spoke head protein 9
MTSLANIDRVAAASGFTLSVEELAGLELALIKRSNEENLSNINFWGKIFGASADFLIAVSIVTSADFPVKKFYFCTNKDFSLQALPEIEENDILAELRKNNFNYRFSGDPSFQLEEERRAEAAEDEEGEDLTYREVNHLGFVVRNIDSATTLVPNSAYVLNAADLLVANSGFAGLDFSSAVDLSNYRHLRHPQARPSMWHNRGGLADAGKLLDVVGGDRAAPLGPTPVGVWSIVRDANGTSVRIRSLEYPGFNFFHVIGTPLYGNTYFGDGNFNFDLPFMV